MNPKSNQFIFNSQIARENIQLKMQGLVFLCLVFFVINVSSFKFNKQSSTFNIAKFKINSPIIYHQKSVIETKLHQSVTASAPVAASKDSSIFQKLKLGSLFGLWYVLNIGYNIYNKNALNGVGPNLTYTVAFLQLFLGLFYILPLWILGIRKVPVLSNDDVKTLLPVALLHTLTHVGAVVSLSAGGFLISVCLLL